MRKFSQTKQDIYQMSDFANLGPGSLTGSISLQRSYGATRADLNYAETKLISHKVEASDTLQGLAVKYGVTVEKLKRLNKLWSNESLFLKEFINIPYTAPINNWDEDEDEDEYDRNQDLSDESENISDNAIEAKKLNKTESQSESECTVEDSKATEENYNEFLFGIDDRIKKCKNEWERKEKQLSSKSRVPCVSYESSDANKLSPTKQTCLEKL